MSLTNEHYERHEGGTTSRLLVLQWSQLGNHAARRQAFGGRINGQGFERIADGVYLISRSVSIESIHNILMESLDHHDRAVLSYPFGTTDDGASAMRVRRYGRAVTN